MEGVTIAQGGVLPNIQAVLLPKKSQCAAVLHDLVNVIVLILLEPGVADLPYVNGRQGSPNRPSTGPPPALHSLHLPACHSLCHYSQPFLAESVP